jgi:cholesterol transport system auxiliary component
MRRPALLRLAAAALLAISLSGCISLLPRSKASQLYRFGVPTSSTAPDRSTTVPVFRVNGVFQREAAGDRILTITGERAAFIGQARWVAPAEVLFDEAVANAFESTPGRVRLVTRGEPVRAGMVLRLDVRNFETRYSSADNPVVYVRVRAVFARDHAQVTERIFEAQAPADQNRVTAIVAAYNQALAKVLGEIVAWTNSSVA